MQLDIIVIVISALIIGIGLRFFVDKIIRHYSVKIGREIPNDLATIIIALCSMAAILIVIL
jgi:hypothetical protein